MEDQDSRGQLVSQTPSPKSQQKALQSRQGQQSFRAVDQEMVNKSEECAGRERKQWKIKIEGARLCAERDFFGKIKRALFLEEANFSGYFCRLLHLFRSTGIMEGAWLVAIFLYCFPSAAMNLANRAFPTPESTSFQEHQRRIPRLFDR